MTRMGFIQDELDLKLLVMYIMARAAGPITFLQLYDIALCDAGVDYFSLNQAVQHLVTTGNLQKDGDLFSPTEKGRRNSEITDSSLPYSVRAKCDENLVALNDALRRQQQVQAQVEPQKDGTCHLSLLLADESGPLLKLSVLLPAPQEGAKAAERFRQSPDQLYHQIAALLCQDAAHEEEP